MVVDNVFPESQFVGNWSSRCAVVTFLAGTLWVVSIMSNLYLSDMVRSLARQWCSWRLCYLEVAGYLEQELIWLLARRDFRSHHDDMGSHALPAWNCDVLPHFERDGWIFPRFSNQLPVSATDFFIDRENQALPALDHLLTNGYGSPDPWRRC